MKKYMTTPIASKLGRCAYAGVGPRDGDQDRSLFDSYTSKKGITLGELQRNAKNVLLYDEVARLYKKT